MSYYNVEHYPDPTAAEAMDRATGAREAIAEGEEGCRRLAEVVILTAAKDYADLLRRPYRSDTLLREKQDLESFFLSDRFFLLSGMNGAKVIRTIRKEVLGHDRA